MSPLWLSSCDYEFCCSWFSLSALIIMTCLRKHNAVHNNTIIYFYTFIVIVLRAQTSWVNFRVHLNLIYPILMLLSKLYPQQCEDIITANSTVKT